MINFPWRLTRSSQPVQTPFNSRRQSCSTSLFVSHCCKLFLALSLEGSSQKCQPLCNQANPNSSYKTPGVGYLCDALALPASRLYLLGLGWGEKYATNPFACHTCKIDPRKFFRGHTYEKHGGGWGQFWLSTSTVLSNHGAL